jgi:HIV Tat-specific factor 1
MIGLFYVKHTAHLTFLQVPAAPVLARESKKRKVPEDYTSPTPPPGGPSIKRGKGKNNGDGDKPKSKNTAVYVTGLPPDATHDEIHERFSKCGLIEEDDEGEPKIKMYAKEDGSFSGDALVVYFKEDSVLLAENLLDEAELRLGEGSTVMSVKKADFSHKGGSGGGQASTGEASGAPRRTVDKKKATKRIGKMQR